MAKNSHSLSVLLLKKDISVASDVLKNMASVTQCDLPLLCGTATLFYKQNPTHLPSWVKLFSTHAVGALDHLYNTGTSAVLIAKHSTRFFALTFGYGKTLLRSDCYEENFGLKVVLNSVDPEKLRSIDAQSLDAVPVNVRSQASVATSLADFGVDIDKDLIYAATGKPKNPELGKQITGKDSIKLSIKFDLEGLDYLLGKLLTQFTSTSYKNHFSWIDHLSEVRDNSLITNLDNSLSHKIQSNDFSRTWLAIPEIIDWEDVSGFKYQQAKHGEGHDDISWEDYLAFSGDNAKRTVDEFKKHHVLCMGEASGQAKYSWPVYKCIYCEITHDKQTYTLNNGKWYRVDQDFLRGLDSAIQNIPKSTIVLPNYTEKNEEIYNIRVYNSDKARYALMDKKLIGYSGGSSKIELCDLLTNDKKFIHVKRYAGSSVLSHLFAQGLVSARLLLSDADFRRAANTKLPSSHRIANPDKKPIASNFEVIYVIASKHSTDATDLPLFSKITLRNSATQLQLLGMNVSLSFIHAS